MNEWIFFGHCLFVIASLLLFSRLQEKGLCAFIACCWILANIFATKQIKLFGLNVISSDVYTIGAMFGLNILQELYGKQAAKQAIFISVLLISFMTGASILHLSYMPSVHDTMHGHFQSIFGIAPRLMTASLLSFLISQRLEIKLYSWLAQATQWPFGIRSAMTVVTSQCIDTILVTVLSLYGIAHSLGDIIVVSYLIKLAVTAAGAPFLLLCSRLIIKKTDIHE